MSIKTAMVTSLDNGVFVTVSINQQVVANVAFQSQTEFLEFMGAWSDSLFPDEGYNFDAALTGSKSPEEEPH